MGLISCKRHGLMSILFACSHIRKAIDLDTNIDGITISKMILGDFGEEEISFTYAYCANCREIYSLPYEGVLSEDLVVEDEFKPLCSECFEEFKQTVKTI
jgi:hypothetical protein